MPRGTRIPSRETQPYLFPDTGMVGYAELRMLAENRGTNKVAGAEIVNAEDSLTWQHGSW